MNSLSYTDSGKVEAAILLNCFQRPGYFPSRQNISERLIDFVRHTLFGERSVSLLLSKRHARRIEDQIRTHLDIKMVNAASDGQRLLQFDCDMAITKESTIDIINAMIDQLVHDSFELPAFSTLNRIGIHARAQSLHAIYAKMVGPLPATVQYRLYSTDTHKVEPHKALAVHGAGGIGKTRAAMEHAWRYITEYSAALFVPAQSPGISATRILRKIKSRGLQCQNSAFVRLGAVAAVVHADNCTTAVTLASGGEQYTYRRYADRMRFHVDPCLPR